MWATKFCDILRPAGFEARAGFTEAAETRRFYEWLRDRVRENTPYDELAERILLATSQEGSAESGERTQGWVDEVRALMAENTAKTPDLKAYTSRKTLDLYWQRTGAGRVKGTLQVAHAFLGLRLECAQCHRHPHDVWQQDDLLSFANFFMRIGGSAAGGSSAPVVKEADRLLAETKGLKEEAKKIGDQAKDKSLSKEEIAKLQAEAKTLNDKAAAIEALGKRLKATEIHSGGKATFASVTSTLGQQESKQFRLLGEDQSRNVLADQDPREIVMAAAAGQSVLCAGHRQSSLGALFWSRHRRAGRSALAAQSGLASGALDRAMHRFREVRLRPEAPAPHNPREPHLSAEREDECNEPQRHDELRLGLPPPLAGRGAGGRPESSHGQQRDLST
jgi:hypothetical protein